MLGTVVWEAVRGIGGMEIPLERIGRLFTQFFGVGDNRKEDQCLVWRSPLERGLHMFPLRTQVWFRRLNGEGDLNFGRVSTYCIVLEPCDVGVYNMLK